MATNIEIKARVKDFARLIKLAEELSGGPGEVIQQEDVFFRIPAGRLKLRLLASDRGELIYYERENASGPKASNYYLSRTTTPQTLKEVLSAALGARGVVRKRRLLYLVGQTRLHLDQVEGLGEFLELEVVLSLDQTAAEGETTAAELMRQLGVQEADLIDRAYIDLLETQQSL